MGEGLGSGTGVGEGNEPIHCGRVTLHPWLFSLFWGIPSVTSRLVRQPPAVGLGGEEALGQQGSCSLPPFGTCPIWPAVVDAGTGRDGT